MKRKIYLLVILIGLGGAIVMGYMVFRGQTVGNPEIAVEGSGDAAYQILPHGRDLNFKDLEQYNKNKNLFPYPKVAPSEIGLPIDNIME